MNVATINETGKFFLSYNSIALIKYLIEFYVFRFHWEI